VKKPYHPPKLTAYGDLTQMTQGSMAGMGMFDNKMAIKRT
jgi:hypothetical protein